MSERKEFILEGLCCANCAAKIEKEVGDMAEVKESNINLMNNKLSITLNPGQSAQVDAKVRKIVHYHEPSVKVLEVSKDKGQSDDGHGHEHVHEHGHDHGEHGDRKLYFTRLVIAVIITIILSFVNTSGGVKLAFYLVAYALVGFEILATAVKNILKGKVFDENFLMGFASLGAFVIGERVEAIAVLVFYGVGEILQDMAVSRSKKNIEGLMDIRPDYANKLDGTNVTVVAPEQISVGDTILIKPGEKVPLDGVVVKGNSFIDTRALTGESVPREVTIQETVLSGTINTSGVLEVEVTKPFGETTVSKILELVQNAGSKKAESEKFITKFARYYTPVVVFTAAAVAILPPVLGFGSFTDWLYRALSFLIISCPCALVISIPLSFFGGIGGGAKQGILVKGGNYLDALKDVDTIVFDKTGTLTKGVFEVTKVHSLEGIPSEELLRNAVLAERHSNHPIAKSILTYYSRNNSIEKLPVADITEIAGHGVIAKLGRDIIYAGNEKLMKKQGILYQSVKASGSIVYIAVNQQYQGYILIADEVKTGAKDAISALKKLGVRKTIMLTGDQKNVAKEIAQHCNIDEFVAELLPQDKVAWFEKYKNQTETNGKIVFVGDGINDAPVLAGADIGIAMGGIGSDAAIEAADVVIMNDEIGKIVTAIKIARKTKQIVTQNIILALGVKFLIMILAFFDITSIWFAIFADVGVALIALANAMRAMYIKK